MDTYDDLAALTAYSKVPIAGGELHSSGYPELKYMIERKCYHIYQPDALFTGGIAQTEYSGNTTFHNNSSALNIPFSLGGATRRS